MTTDVLIGQEVSGDDYKKSDSSVGLLSDYERRDAFDTEPGARARSRSGRQRKRLAWSRSGLASWLGEAWWLGQSSRSRLGWERRRGRGRRARASGLLSATLR